MKFKTHQSLDKENGKARAAADFSNRNSQHSFAVMPKLEVGQVGDKFEQEADRTADHVVNMPENHAVQKEPLPEEKVQKATLPEEKVQKEPLPEEKVQKATLPEEKVQKKPVTGETSSWIQREEKKEEEKPVQKKSENLSQHEIPETSWLENQINNSKGSGDRLPDESRSFMESRFGANFSDVKVHTGIQAGILNRSLNAQAFTHGSDVYFGEGKYNPESRQGKHLLAHELTHVVQQTFSSSPATAIKSGGTAESLTIHNVTKGVNRFVQMTQDVDERRGSRIDVANSVQAFRVTYPDQSGGLLTQALIRQLQRAQTAGEATSAVGSGQRRFGSRAGSAEERAGVSLGQASSPPENTTAERVAVVIGNGNYDQSTNMGSMALRNRPLTTTISDAESVAARMRDLNYAVTLLTDQNAAQINQELTNQINRLQQGSELFFYFSGHGLIEGLVGIDGSVFTPAQMVTIRDTARNNLVSLVINTDACHSGVFADAIRGAELTDTLRANQSQSSPSVELTAMLQGALDIQSAKNNFNTSINTWWAERYEIENRMNVAATRQVIAEWENHYNQGRDIWNNFVTACNPLLEALRSNAGVAGLTLEALMLPTLAGNLNSDKEDQIQAGLDDVDTLLNQVLTYSDNRLP
jgi:hypothetical protein